MNIANIFLTMTLLISLATKEPNNSIYYTKKVFTFNVEIRKTTKDISKKKIYLTTFNELWPYDNQKWMGWEDDLQNIKRKESGVLETSTEIFLHPPRKDQYAILEFSPFPIVHFPLSVGKEWDWSLEIGSHWAKMAGIENFDSLYNFNYSYKITNKTTYNFNKSIIDCFVIEANCNSPYGESKLISYFNDQYGFVKLEYLNLDGSCFIFSLIKVQELAEIENASEIYKLILK
jgi:hypothetical protein